MKITFYCSEEGPFGTGRNIMIDLCTLEGIHAEIIRDTKKAVTLSNFKHHPAYAYCAVAPDGTVLKDIYDLVHWIDGNGFRRMI